MTLGEYVKKATIPVPKRLSEGLRREYYVVLGWESTFAAQAIEPLVAAFVTTQWPDARHVAQQTADRMDHKMWIVAVDDIGREVYEFPPAVPGVENFKAGQPVCEIDGWGEF